MKENSLFEKNLEIIKECDNLLYDELIKYDLASYEIENVETEEALDGTKIIKSFINQHEWYFNSKYEPKEIAKCWVDKLGKIESTAVITLFGLGNGLYLKEMMDRTYQSVIFIIYEPSIDIFLKAMKDINFSFLDKRVFIAVEGINDIYFDAYFQSFIVYGNLSVCKYLWHPNYFNFFKNSREKYLQKIKNGLTVLQAYTNSDIRLSQWYYINSLSNLKFLPKASIFDQIVREVGKSIPEDLPAIIVSAGPSLKNNVKELKKAKNRAFIIATDTALKCMFSEDIIPDVVITIDAAKNPNKFTDDRTDNIPMICFETARHINLDKHKANKIFMNDTFGFGDKLYKDMGIKYQYWSGGSSVATNSYAIAMAMGFRTIILVGQDLAYTNNQRHYESGMSFADLDKVDDSGIFIEVEDINGGKIYTSKDFKLYLDWFEAEIALHSEIETIDATEGGAKIHGSHLMSLEEAICEKCKTEFDMEKYMKNVPPLLAGGEKIRFLNFIKEIPMQFEDLLKEVEEVVELYSNLIKELEKAKPDNSKLLKLSKSIGEITEKIEKSKAYQIAQHKLKTIEYTTLSNLGVSCEDATEDALEVSKRGIFMMEALRLELNEVIPYVKQSVENVSID